MMLDWGIEVTYESIRGWNNKFAQSFANEIHRRRAITSIPPFYTLGFEILSVGRTKVPKS
jgi:hypothetical protein